MRLPNERKKQKTLTVLSWIAMSQDRAVGSRAVSSGAGVSRRHNDMHTARRVAQGTSERWGEERRGAGRETCELHFGGPTNPHRRPTRKNPQMRETEICGELHVAGTTTAGHGLEKGPEMQLERPGPHHGIHSSPMRGPICPRRALLTEGLGDQLGAMDESHRVECVWPVEHTQAKGGQGTARLEAECPINKLLQ